MKLFRIFKDELPFFFSAPALLWQIVFFYIPIVFVVLISVKSAEVPGAFTLSHYTQFFSFPFLYIVARSSTLALCTALLCLFIGYPVAWYIARSDRLKHVMLFFLLLPFWTNMLVQVYAWFAVLEYNGLLNMCLQYLGFIDQPLEILNSRYAIYMVMVYYYLPFMILPLYAVLEKLDDAYIEASRDLGATYAQTFFKVVIPLSMSGVVTGFFLVLIPAFGEFVIPNLMGGNKYMYVGSLISYYYLVARNSYLGAAFTVLSSLILFVVAYLLYRVLSQMTASGADV